MLWAPCQILSDWAVYAQMRYRNGRRRRVWGECPLDDRVCQGSTEVTQPKPKISLCSETENAGRKVSQARLHVARWTLQ